MNHCINPNCTKTSPYYAKSLCKNCYMRDLRARKPEMFKKCYENYRTRNLNSIRERDRKRNALPERKARLQKYFKENPEARKASEKKRSTCPIRKEYVKQLREKNRERIREHDRKRYERDKPKRIALVNRRRGYIGQSTPKWLTPKQKEEMVGFYKNRPDDHHVDHIVPLKGKNVCGLNVPWNLQYLPAEVNLRKSNKFNV